MNIILMLLLFNLVTSDEEYEVLIVDKGSDSSTLRSSYIGVYTQRSFQACNRPAYLHYTTNVLLHRIASHWCLTSAYYNQVSSCNSGLGFYHTKTTRDDVTLGTWSTDITITEACFIPTISNSTSVTSSYDNGAVVGEVVRVTCTTPALDNYYTCGQGNTWEPYSITNACRNKVGSPTPPSGSGTLEENTGQFEFEHDHLIGGAITIPQTFRREKLEIHLEREYRGYEVLIVDKGSANSELDESYVGVYVNHGEPFCERAAYVNIAKEAILYSITTPHVSYWCLDSVDDTDYMMDCDTRLGLYHTLEFEEDVTKTDWTADIKVSEACLIPTIKNVISVKSSHDHAAIIGEDVIVYCGFDSREYYTYTCLRGNTWQPSNIYVACLHDRASVVNSGGFYVGNGLLVEGRGNLDTRENRDVGFCPSSHPYAFRDDLCCSDNDEKECDKFHVLWIPCEYETCQDFDIEVKKIKLFDASITSRYIFGYHGPENAIDGDFRTVAVSDLTQSNLTIWLSQNHQESYVISKLIIYTEQYFWYLPKLMKVTLKSNNGDQSPCRSILTKDPYEKYISTCTIPFAANQIVVSSRTEEPIFINEIEVYGYSHDMEEHKIAELKNEPGYRLGIKRIGGKLTAVSAIWGAPT